MTVPEVATSSSSDLTLDGVRVLLCDGDGNLYPSEEPAFDASADVMNDFLTEIGIPAAYTGEQLRLQHTGMNFRSTALLLCRQRGIALEAATLEHWVEVEKQVVTRHLAQTLLPDPGVRDPLTALSRSFSLALVTSSATSRVDACLEATGLDQLFAAATRFSAEDSLPEPRSKPDPAVYELAARACGGEGPRGLAIEDSVPGVQSAVAAGIPVVGNVQFVQPEERDARSDALLAAGAVTVVGSWSELLDYAHAA